MRGGGWAVALQQDPGAWTLNHAWGSGRYLAAGTARSRHADKTLKWFGLIHRLKATLSSSAERSRPCPCRHFRTPLCRGPGAPRGAAAALNPDGVSRFVTGRAALEYPATLFFNINTPDIRWIYGCFYNITYKCKCVYIYI